MSVEAHRHGQRRGTAAEWTAANPVLAGGELGIETDTSLMKIGDGITLWSALAYANRGAAGPTGPVGPTGAGVPDTSTASEGDAVIFDGNSIVWGVPGTAAPAPNAQNFTASGTWTKPAGATRVVAELISGGGGSSASGNSGGGGGGYLRVEFNAANLNSTQAVTVGAGGSTSSGGASSFGGATVAGGGGGAFHHGGDGGGGGGVGSITSGVKGYSSYFGGGGGGYDNSSDGGSSMYGAGGGGFGSSGHGGTSLDPSALLGGNGGGNGVAGTAPGGGGGSGAAGARGAVRITTYFD